jgi:hypothetical protein
VKREWNDQVQRITFSPVLPLAAERDVSTRERRSENANLTFWVAPTERLNLSAQASYLRTAVDQTVLFTSFAPAHPPATFQNRARVLGVGANLAATERLDLGMNLQRIRSSALFDPQLVSGDPDLFLLDTTGISSITQQETTIVNFSVRGGYRFSQSLSGSLEYTLRDYDEKNPAYSSYNGTVHAVVAYLSTKW